jgi:hypothetical protein
MVIKVKYDAYTRTFKLVEPEFRTLLEDDATYDLAVPFDFEEVLEEELFSVSGAKMAHA